MILTRSPLRISLGGGGTDLPSYSRKFGGFVLAAAIDKYVYLALHETFVRELIIKYSKMERVKSVDDVEHPIIREALRLTGCKPEFFEIVSMADIPAGSGLGSSGSFTTALLKTLHTYQKNTTYPERLAEEACRLEIEILKEPVGKQDQYIAAYGGLTCFEFLPEGKIEISHLKISEETLYNLEDNLLLFFTGYTRAASEILQDQESRSLKTDPSIIENLNGIKKLGYEIKETLEAGNLREFGRLMDEHWREKKKRSEKITNPQIDEWYRLAMDNGALGGKLIGAGGGGFLMFYTEEKSKLRHALRRAGLPEVRFRFDFEGTKVVIQ